MASSPDEGEPVSLIAVGFNGLKEDRSFEGGLRSSCIGKGGLGGKYCGLLGCWMEESRMEDALLLADTDLGQTDSSEEDV